MIEVDFINFSFLEIDFIPDILERQCGVDDNVFDAGHVKTPSFFECFSDEGRDIPLFEDLNDLFSRVFLFFGFLLGDAVLVDFLPEFTHGEFAVSDLADKGRGD